MSTAGYNSFTADFEVGSNHPHEVFNARYAINSLNGYRIDGQVIDGNNGGALLAGVLVSTNGVSATTGNDGKFALDFSTASSYALTFAKGGYLTVNGSYGVSDSRPRKYTGNVTLMNGYTVTGAVKDIDKNGIIGVTVSIAGQTATTGSDGIFTVSGIKQYGSQKVTLSKNGRTLERSVNISRTRSTVSAGTFYLVDSYVIQGQVLTVKNEAAVGLTVVSGNVSDTTDDNGMYLLRIPNSGTHTVTLEHSGYKQVSTSVGVSDTNPNVTARNALYAIDINDGYYIYGNIKLADPDVLPSDITIEVPKSDGSIVTAQPDADGNFVLQGLQDGEVTMPLSR
ncbi:lipoprotein [Beggiatoa sp. PS]|nr:lipoprotein [Beggiatoa sp. PS]